MKGTESFLKRWSRRKAESTEGSEVSPAGPAPAPEEAKPKRRQATPAPPPETSEPAQAAFYPASLPPIESIDASADIRPFLQAGAPAELTQAALRRPGRPTRRFAISLASPRTSGISTTQPPCQASDP